MIEANGFTDGTHGDSRPRMRGSPTDLRVADDVARPESAWCLLLAP
jgi:hypothetical protein